VGGAERKRILDGEQGMDGAHHEIVSLRLHLRAVEHRVQADIKKLLTIRTPNRKQAAFARNLPAPTAAGKLGHINFFTARVGGRISQPAAVRRQARKLNPRLSRSRFHEREGLTFSVKKAPPTTTRRWARTAAGRRDSGRLATTGAKLPRPAIQQLRPTIRLVRSRSLALHKGWSR